MPFDKKRTRVSISIFSKETFQEYRTQKLRLLVAEIESRTLDYILGVNETDYAQYLINQYTIDVPIIDFVYGFSNWEERYVIDNYTFVIVCSLPFQGDYSYLQYIPSGCPEEQSLLRKRKREGYFSTTATVFEVFAVIYRYYYDDPQKFVDAIYTKEIIKQEIQYYQNEQALYRPALEEMQNALTDADTIAEPIIHLEISSGEKSGNKEEARRIFNSIKICSKLLTQQIKEYNNEVSSLAPRLIRERRKRILKNDQTLKSVGLPIKKRENLPETYTIPTPNFRKSVTVMPVVPDKHYEAEPTLKEKDYVDILQTIHDIGKVFERLPSTYSNRREEELRDLFLLYLEPRYEGSATGETFNGSGKTDILIRYKNSNVFIAECKFWNGSKEYLDAITQLLSYLTWRDSKAAIIIFARTKAISSVLQTIKDVTPEHPNFLSFVNEKEQSWLNYRFHINNDRNREVKLAALLFHFPPVRGCF